MAAEGGGAGNSNSFFPWKMQRIFQLPSGVANRTRESLPAPPEGMEWVQKNDANGEWRLVKAALSVPPAQLPTKEPELVTEEKLMHNACNGVTVPVTPEACTDNFKAAPSASSVGMHNNDQLPPRCGVVDRLPSDKSCKEEDWELLSDRLSTSSNQTPGVVIHHHRAISNHSGSVRSLTSMEGEHYCNNITSDGSQTNTNNNTLSLPFKIQRTASSSTIDSSENNNYLGPSGKGVLGVDYVEHVVLPTDTLQGICLAYKIGSSTRLRQANHFSGNSLLLAPKKLVIPLSKKALRSGFIRVQDTDAKEYKLHAMLAEFPDLSMTEAKA